MVHDEVPDITIPELIYTIGTETDGYLKAYMTWLKNDPDSEAMFGATPVVDENGEPFTNKQVLTVLRDYRHA